MDKHIKISFVTGMQLILILLFSHFAHAVEQFDVKVPDRGALGFQAIRDIELFVELPSSTTGNVNFKVSRNSSEPQEKDFTVSSTIGGGGTGTKVTHIYDIDDDGIGKSDQVSIQAVTNDSESSKRFKVHMELETNWQANPTCDDRQSTEEIWTVKTRTSGGTPAPSIIGACIQSYEAQNNGCTPSPTPIQAADSPATINQPSGTQIPTVAPCVDNRPKPPILLIK